MGQGQSTPAAPAGAGAAPPAASGCPMKAVTGSAAYKNPNQFNVYSQKIDTVNNMPSTANQQPAPNQTKKLPTERVQSTIPKGGTEAGTWSYPSPQMFWNALVRKDKTDGADEEDMESVIAIHNNMNENTWTQIMAWENFHPTEGAGREPKLLRFAGKPADLSPKARLKVAFGHSAPFDRHDWIIDRGGVEVRYVIDYYSDESVVQKDQTPTHLHDLTSMKSIKLDVRPALDSFGALLDRAVRMPVAYHLVKHAPGYSPLPFFASSEMTRAEKEKVDRLKRNWTDIKSQCAAAKSAMATCTSEDDCSAKSVVLQTCIGGVVCPSVVREFNSCMALKKGSGKISTAYGEVVRCLDTFLLDSKNVR